MAEAVVKISVADAASTRLAGLARELKELAKVAKSAGSPDAQRLSTGAGQLQSVADKFGVVQKEASGATQALGTAKNALCAFTSSAGLGFGKSLLGLGGAVAFAAAAGKIIGDSIKLATEFERVSQRATFSLALGQGNLGAQLNSLKAATGSYANLGLDKTAAAELIGTYGSASGATKQQAQDAGQSIAQYGRGFGIDPTALAAQMGIMSQYAGKNVSSNASELFGAARSAGDAGRRPTELLGTAVNLLSQMQASNPMGGIGIKSALKEIVGITKLGGYFQTQQGMQTTIGGFNAMGSAVKDNPALTNMAMKSGWSISDIIMGSTDSKKLNALFENMYKETGGNRNLLAASIGSVITGPQGTAVLTAVLANKGNILGSYDPVSKKSLDAAVAAYNKTTTGQLDTAGAKVKNVEIDAGDAILKVISPRLADAATELSSLSDALTNLHFPEGMGEVTTALGAVAVALAFKSGLKVPSFSVSGGAKGAEEVAAKTGWGSRLLGLARGGLAATAGVLASPAGLGLAAFGALVLSKKQEAGGTENEDSMALDNDAMLARRRAAKHPAGKFDLERWVYGIGETERDKTLKNPYLSKGVWIDGDRALGKYQFMGATLAGQVKWKGNQADARLAKSLGGARSVAFQEYFLAHGDMQERYIRQAAESYRKEGYLSEREMSARHNGGYGGASALRQDGGYHYGYGKGKNFFSVGNYADSVGGYESKYDQFHPSAAVANAQHPAHQGNQNHGHTSGGGSSGSGGSAKVKVPIGHNGHMEVSIKHIPGHDRTKPGTFRS